MSLIKAAIVYSAEIPVDADTLHNHLSERSFLPPMTYQAESAGFVPPVGADTGCGLVATFPGGMAFSVRIDEKILPASVVRDRVDAAIEEHKKQTGVTKVGKKTRAEIRANTMNELLAIALVRTRAIITCFYHCESKQLIVATGSKKLADTCTSLLIQAVGSVKTSTIHVSGVKHGLTTRLKNWIYSEGADEFTAPEGEQIGFGEFRPVDNVVLAGTGEDRRKMSISVGDLMINSGGILEAIQKGSEVKSLGLSAGTVSFRLTDDFHFKSIEHVTVEDDSDDETEYSWASKAAIEVAALHEAINAMLEMFAYKAPEQSAEATTDAQQEGGAA